MTSKSDETNDEAREAESDTLGLFEVIGSVFAAAFGVQSDKNRRRDFSKGKPSTYIIAGLIFTVAFVLILVTLVQLILGVAAS